MSIVFQLSHSMGILTYITIYIYIFFQGGLLLLITLFFSSSFFFLNLPFSHSYTPFSLLFNCFPFPFPPSFSLPPVPYLLSPISLSLTFSILFFFIPTAALPLLLSNFSFLSSSFCLSLSLPLPNFLHPLFCYLLCFFFVLLLVCQNQLRNVCHINIHSSILKPASVHL